MNNSISKTTPLVFYVISFLGALGERVFVDSASILGFGDTASIENAKRFDSVLAAAKAIVKRDENYATPKKGLQIVRVEQTTEPGEVTFTTSTDLKLTEGSEEFLVIANVEFGGTGVAEVFNGQPAHNSFDSVNQWSKNIADAKRYGRVSDIMRDVKQNSVPQTIINRDTILRVIPVTSAPKVSYTETVVA